MTAHTSARLVAPDGNLTADQLKVVDQVAAERRAAALRTTPNGWQPAHPHPSVVEDLIRAVYMTCGYRFEAGDLRIHLVDGPSAGVRASWSPPAPPLAGRFDAVIVARARSIAETITGGNGDRLRNTLAARLGPKLQPLAGIWGTLVGAMNPIKEAAERAGEPAMFTTSATLTAESFTFTKVEPAQVIDPWTWGGTYLAQLIATYRLAGTSDPALDCLVEAIDTLGPWWSVGGQCWVAPRPRVMRLGGNGLHCADGPAVAWEKDLKLYSWRGTTVPKDLIDPGWTADYVLRRREVELRRCAIERMGWETFIFDTGMEQLGQPIADPGNPGQTLTLYRVRANTVGPRAFNVLVCTNGSPERDGTRRSFGLKVPPEITDPLRAAALMTDDRTHPLRMTPAIYATAARRT